MEGKDKVEGSNPSTPKLKVLKICMDQFMQFFFIKKRLFNH